MDIREDFFQTFGLEKSYEIDFHELQRRYRDLQKQHHPDRFAQASDQKRRLAVQYASYLNEGLATLKSDLKRALYLLRLHGRDQTSEKARQLPPEFLMEQMELREQLELIEQGKTDLAALDALATKINAEVERCVAELNADFAESTASSLDHAEELTRKLQFLTRLAEEIDSVEEKISSH